MLSVTYFYREPRKTGFSMEGIFRLVSDCLKDKIEIKEFFCDAKLSRFQNTLNVGKYASEINHITGDVNFLALGLIGKKNILTIHDFGFYENPIHSFLVKLIYKIFWYYLPLKNIELVTVVSDFTKNKLISYFAYPANKIKVIPNPVKPIFKFVKKEKINETPVILMLGTGKHKNLDNLIEAVGNNNLLIEIVGWVSNDELDKLKKFGIAYKIYNSLTDEEVFERYVACDILYIASFYEGFGMPIIEAQAVGRPVITSNIGAMKELAEENAVIVNPHSPADIKQAILSLLDKTFYDEIVEKGRINAAKYNYKIISEQYLEAYQQIREK